MYYKLSGQVVRGDGYGRKLGFPTINLETEDSLPPAGVYAGSAILENQPRQAGLGKSYRAGILINPKKDGQSKVEAHLIGFTGDAYGKTVALELIKFLRDYKKFGNEQELIAQIEKDLREC